MSRSAAGQTGSEKRLQDAGLKVAATTAKTRTGRAGQRGGKGLRSEDLSYINGKVKRAGETPALRKATT
jgi:hypothetical protein